MTMIKNRTYIIRVFVILLVSMMAACAPASPTTEVLPIASTAVTEESTATEAPEVATATPGIPTVILAYDSEADPFAISQTQSALEQLLIDSTMTLVIQEGLTLEMLAPNVEVVVGVGPTLKLGDLAASAPNISFVAVNHPGLQQTENLSVVGDPQFDQQQQAFMAGFLAALVSEDYKVAALVPPETENTILFLDPFVNGARFYCGSCRPLYPPYNSFPQWETLSPENAATGFGTVVDSLVAKSVEIIYIPGSLATPEILSSLAELNIKVIGDTSPDILRNNWIGTIKADPGTALMQLWPNLLDGSDGKQISSLFSLDDTDSNLVTEGRYRIFEKVADDLQAGLISPGAMP